jgi:hypothetical protein
LKNKVSFRAAAAALAGAAALAAATKMSNPLYITQKLLFTCLVIHKTNSNFLNSLFKYRGSIFFITYDLGPIIYSVYSCQAFTA